MKKRIFGNGRACMCLVVAAGLSACGGGGGGDAGGADLGVSRLHAEATATLSVAQGPRMLAASYMVTKAFHAYLRGLPGWLDLSGVSPARPSVRFACNGGVIVMTYTDGDGNGQVSAGDTLRLQNDGCGAMSASGGGSELLTVLAGSGGRITAATVRFNASRYDRLLPSGAWALVSGTARWQRSGDSGLLDNAQGLTVELVEAEAPTVSLMSLTVGNLAVLKLAAGAYAANAEISMDLGLADGGGSLGRVQVETEGAITLVEATNEAPMPGKLRLRGAGGGVARLAGDPNITQFRVDIDPTGSGTPALSRTTEVGDFFAPLHP